MIRSAIVFVLCFTKAISSQTIQVVHIPISQLRLCHSYYTLEKCIRATDGLTKIPPTTYFRPKIYPRIGYRRKYLRNQLITTRYAEANIFTNSLSQQRNITESDIKTKMKDNELKEIRNDLKIESNRSQNVSGNVTGEQGRRSGNTLASETENVTDVDRSGSLLKDFTNSLEQFERLFYITTFNKLVAMNSVHDHGISFIQSGLFLQLALIALSTEVDMETKMEIDQILQFNASDAEKLATINQVLNSLPKSNNDTKFHWGTRLILGEGRNVSDQFRKGAAAKLHLKIDNFNGTNEPKKMAGILNKMVETDSAGVLQNSFDEDDLSNNVEAVLVTTIYLRARWRSAPTLLNGTHDFHNSIDGPPQTIRMIRINDIMNYAALDDCDAQAIEVFYFDSDLSILILVPNGNSLKHLANKVSKTDVGRITEKMRPLRIAATLPLYTLRMTLLLPNKLRTMGLTRLVGTDNSTHMLRISHGVQRLMFWAEAGRHAYKDDGLEWDERPDKGIVIDRPYIFYVRWRNMTLMNGNFVL